MRKKKHRDDLRLYRQVKRIVAAGYKEEELLEILVVLEAAARAR